MVGSISFITNPPSAQIWLDGNDTGKVTPFVLTNVAAGSHTVTYKLASGYALVWNDEFDGTTLNTTKWNNPPLNDTGCSPRNNEQEIYTPDEVYLDGTGNLILRSEIKSSGGCSYTSGAVSTQGKFTQQYGKFEVRARLPDGGEGVWPAVWLWPDLTWPPEIDILESVNDMGIAYNDVWWGTLSNPQHLGSQWYSIAKGSYHTFAIEWEPGIIRWYIDNSQVRIFESSNVPNIPMKIYINTALGGNWPGPVGASTVFPQYFYIDYVRVYKLSSFNDCVQQIQVLDGQTTESSCILIPTGCPLLSTVLSFQP